MAQDHFDSLYMPPQHPSLQGRPSGAFVKVDVEAASIANTSEVCIEYLQAAASAAEL